MENAIDIAAKVLYEEQFGSHGRKARAVLLALLESGEVVNREEHERVVAERDHLLATWDQQWAEELEAMRDSLKDERETTFIELETEREMNDRYVDAIFTREMEIERLKAKAALAQKMLDRLAAMPVSELNPDGIDQAAYGFKSVSEAYSKKLRKAE